MSDKQRVSFLIGEYWWTKFKEICGNSGLTGSEGIRDAIYKRVAAEMQEKEKGGGNAEGNVSGM